MYRVANVLCFFIILKMWKFKKLYAHPYPEPNYNPIVPAKYIKEIKLLLFV